MLTVGKGGEVAEIILQEIHAPRSKGARILVFVVKGGREACTGTDTGAGIHSELQSLGMDIIGDELHAVREFFGIGHEQPVFVALLQRPAVVNDDILVARVTVAALDHHVRDLQHHLLVDIGSEGIPCVEAHRGRLCQHCHG